MMNNTMIAENIREVFTAFDEYGYDAIIDALLFSKFGERELLFSDDEIEDDAYKQPIFACLYPKWRYILQALDYLASEYNPIENYSGYEKEETEYDVKQRQFTKGQQTNTRTEPLDITKHVEDQHTDQVTPAQKTTTTTADKQTTTNKVAPFESSEYFEKEQTTIEGQQTGGASKVQQVTSQQTADQYTYAQVTHTDTKHFGMQDGYQISAVDGQRIDTDAAHKDKTTRELTRSGNIGVMTAAQMLVQDADFWKNFIWLDDIAHELANLLAVSVWAM